MYMLVSQFQDKILVLHSRLFFDNPFLATRHCPPICPVGVKMDMDRPNSALLTWTPAPNSQTSTRSIFVVERQEVGSQEWQKCFTTETTASAEIAGDSVQCEGDYRFRVCCINKYGRSGHVEFPKAVHLGEEPTVKHNSVLKESFINLLFCFFRSVPGPKIHRSLKGCEVTEGEDAHFSIELSATMVGTWFLNSAQLQHGGRYSIKQSQTKHSLVIHETCAAEDTAEVTFIANGVRDSAVLKVKRRFENLLLVLNLASDGCLYLELIFLRVCLSSCCGEIQPSVRLGQ